jgi:glycosyltransferase involved in cell wall biosynthesis
MADEQRASEAPRRSIVIPVYGNEDTLAHLCDELRSLARRARGGLEAVFVVDGSPDRSLELLSARLPREPFPSQLLALSRNFGSFAAIRAGLGAARGARCAVMAADLQDPPELLESLFAELESGECDIALGHRVGRNDPWATRLAATVFWFFYRRLIQPEVPSGGVDVFACTRKVRDTLLGLHESHSSLVAQLVWLGYRRRLVDYVRRPRGGRSRSSWTLARRWRYLADNVFSFTQLPISALRRLGLLGLAVSSGASLVVLAAWLAGSITVSGYTPIMLLLGISSSIQLLALGVVGEYVWRAYENTKNRPTWIVDRHLSFPGWGNDASNELVERR